MQNINFCQLLMHLGYFQKQEPKMLFDLHLAPSETSERTKIRTWTKKQAYFRRNCKPFYIGYIIGHETQDEQGWVRDLVT